MWQRFGAEFHRDEAFRAGSNTGAATSSIRVNERVAQAANLAVVASRKGNICGNDLKAAVD